MDDGAVCPERSEAPLGGAPTALNGSGNRDPCPIYWLFLGQRYLEPGDGSKNTVKAGFLAVALVLCVWIAVGRATDPNSPMATRLRDLMRPDPNTSCCDASDCRRVESRMTPAGWAARIDRAWIPVPPDRVLRQENPWPLSAMIRHRALRAASKSVQSNATTMEPRAPTM